MDQVLKQLQAARMACERRIADADEFAAEIARHQSLALADDLEVLRREHISLEKRVKEASHELFKAREAAAENLKRQVAESSTNEELRALAQIAIRHLGDRCPVCNQTYDRDQTLRRLEAFLATGPESAPMASDLVRKAASDLSNIEAQFASADASLREAERRATEVSKWNVEKQSRLRELGLEESASTDIKTVDELIPALRAESLRMKTLQDEGEKLALSIGRTGQEAKRQELKREIERLQTELSEVESVLEIRNRTTAEATRILESLREATSDLVEEEIRRLDPLLQRIYARVDPHPAFRIVKLFSRFAYRRGRISVTIEDPLYDISSDVPGAVLSSSQLNSLALSLFLSLNLGVDSLPLDSVLLDDPLQTLDSINLLGVIDLLRRAKGFRQLIVSTHDERFGRLLERKLRPVTAGQTTRVFVLEGWTRQGPSVRRHESEVDVRPLKIAV
jgi:hypothetical protein